MCPRHAWVGVVGGPISGHSVSVLHRRWNKQSRGLAVGSSLGFHASSILGSADRQSLNATHQSCWQSTYVVCGGDSLGYHSDIRGVLCMDVRCSLERLVLHICRWLGVRNIFEQLEESDGGLFQGKARSRVLVVGELAC